MKFPQHSTNNPTPHGNVIDEMIRQQAVINSRKQTLSALERSNLSQVALTYASRISADAKTQNTALGTGVRVEPTAQQVLANAELIYQWLIKE